MKRLSVFLFIFSLAVVAYAETIKLKDGGTVEGTIISDDDQVVVIEVNGRPRTIEWNEVKEISRTIAPDPAAVQEDFFTEQETAETQPDLEMPIESSGEVSNTTDSLSARLGVQGLKEITWGQDIYEIEGLKYSFTDSAAGMDVYLDPDAQADEGGQKDSLPQYYFWNDKFFRLHIPLAREDQWRRLEKELLERFGPGYHLAGPKDVYQWETPDMLVVLRFDAATQSGYLQAESRELAGEINTKDTAGIGSLLKALKNTNTDIRVRAMTSLALMQDERATLPLVRLLSDEDFIVRYNAALALGEIRDERAVVPLIQALGDEDIMVRSFVAEALGRIGDQRAIEPLIDQVENNDAALEALQELTGHQGGKNSQQWQAWWLGYQQKRGLNPS